MTRDPQSSFRQIGDVLAQNVMPSLYRDARRPLRISCIGAARYDGIDDADPFERTVVLGQCPTPEAAMCLASARVARGDIRPGADTGLSFKPRFAVIHDGNHGIVLAGPIRAGIILWQQPVASNAEARRVVSDAARLRGLAFAATDRGEHASARDFRNSATLLEARLVDPDWRDIASALLRLPQAA